MVVGSTKKLAIGSEGVCGGNSMEVLLVIVISLVLVAVFGVVVSFSIVDIDLDKMDNGLCLIHTT
jgi:hypothetical protein